MTRRTEIAVASVVLAIVLIAIGAFQGENDTGYFFFGSLIAIVVAAIVYWVILPRIRRPGLGSLVVAILAVVSLLVFWLGIPSILAGAATVLALDARAQNSEVGKTTGALVLSAVAVVAAVVVAFVG
jgi:Na+-driven multidrug efflux pump